MASVFPDTSVNNPDTGSAWADGDTFSDPSSGLTYTWYNPVWKAGGGGGGGGSVSGDYLPLTGGNLTGDLTLGSDKITLNATNGGADFAGSVKSGDSSTINTRNQPADGTAAQIKYMTQANGAFKSASSGYDPKRKLFLIAGNSSSISYSNDFGLSESGELRLGGDLDTNPNIVLNGGNGTARFGNTTLSEDGSISFKGPLIGNWSGTYNPVGITNKTLFFVGEKIVFAGASEDSHYGYFDSNGSLKIGFDGRGVILNTYGTGQFAGFVHSGDLNLIEEAGAGVELNPNGILTLGKTPTQVAEQGSAFQVYGGSTRTVDIKADGAASFAGGAAFIKDYQTAGSVNIAITALDTGTPAGFGTLGAYQGRGLLQLQRSNSTVATNYAVQIGSESDSTDAVRIGYDGSADSKDLKDLKDPDGAIVHGHAATMNATAAKKTAVV